MVIPVIDSCTFELTSARTRRACWVAWRAVRRKAIAARIVTGAMTRAISVNWVLIKRRTITIINTWNSWLTRLRVKVTTFEKSCVSEVTRLTILPDENSS